MASASRRCKLVASWKWLDHYCMRLHSRTWLHHSTCCIIQHGLSIRNSSGDGLPAWCISATYSANGAGIEPKRLFISDSRLVWFHPTLLRSMRWRRGIHLAHRQVFKPQFLCHYIPTSYLMVKQSDCFDIYSTPHSLLSQQWLTKHTRHSIHKWTTGGGYGIAKGNNSIMPHAACKIELD